MGAYSTNFTFGSATGTSDLFEWTDSSSNTGTGILGHFETQSGSTEIPWQADANGIGWQITAAGVLQSVGSGGTHGITIPAGAAPNGAATKVIYASDSTNGYAEVNENNTGLSRLCTAGNYSTVCPASGGIADATTTVGTTAISANACSTATTVTMTGLATTMTLSFSPNSDIHSVTGWGPGTPGLYLIAWPSAANTASYYVCNSSGSSITPGSSVTFNISAR
jgi:hypothetical protein